MLLGYARGKVGDLVFTRRNGEQVTRPRVRVVNNPKTDGQMIQRMIFASVIAAYSRMKSICDHSWEGVKYGADTQARFMSENLKRLRAFYPTSADPEALAEIDPYKAMAFAIPNDIAQSGVGLIIAKGRLTAPAPVADANGVLIGFGIGADDDHSIIRVLESLGAQKGDQITAVALRDTGNGLIFDKSRYVVNADATNEQLRAQWNGNASADAFDHDKSQVGDVKIFVSDPSAGNLPNVGTDGDDVIAAAIIISRKNESGKWLRSDAVLYCTTDEGAFYSAHYALPYWQYQATDIVTDDPHYLNNADI